MASGRSSLCVRSCPQRRHHRPGSSGIRLSWAPWSLGPHSLGTAASEGGVFLDGRYLAENMLGGGRRDMQREIQSLRRNLNMRQPTLNHFSTFRAPGGCELLGLQSHTCPRASCISSSPRHGEFLGYSGFFFLSPNVKR